MAMKTDFDDFRESLDKICEIPDRIISVYSLEKHVWAEAHSDGAIMGRAPELKTIEEFQIDPVRPFLNDIFRNMAAPYKPDSRENTIGQGYWIQAEFGSGKSHLLCFLASLALGSEDAWNMIKEKEQKAGRGKRDFLYRFWEEGLQAKSANSKGIFVIVKTLVGSGGGTVGYSDSGRRLSEYILDAAKEQLQKELGKNLSLYPVELLADRFMGEDLNRYRNDLRKFLQDPRFFDEDEFQDVDDFLREIQEDRHPKYKLSCGNKLWRFYTEYLKVQPQIEAESEEILRHMVETILDQGYSGVLLLLDEVSLFMKDRTDVQRDDDEKTLVVLSNRLTKAKYNLPIWTVCAAQQKIESKMGAKNIIADDRLKLVPLLSNDKDYYDIVLSRVREVSMPEAISGYYSHYKRGFSWPNAIGEDEFRRFFPFHKPAIEVLKAITYELTTTRSAIHFMHQTLKHKINMKSTELIRLWDFFDDALSYEEDTSGTNAGIAALKTRREDDYRIYDNCKRQIDSAAKGYLKVNRDKAVKTLQTLFLYHISRLRQDGLSPEEIANSVLVERSLDATLEENVQHYESIAENLRKALRQVASSSDEDGHPLYRFDPVKTNGPDPKEEFANARMNAESDEVMRRVAWQHLLALDEWPVRTRQMTYDLSSGMRSIFRDIAPFIGSWETQEKAKYGRQVVKVNWQNREVSGIIEMIDLGRLASKKDPLPSIENIDPDLDFAVFVGSAPVDEKMIKSLILMRPDPRVIIWTPDDLTLEERDRLLDFAAYRKLENAHSGKDSEDDTTIIAWVSEQLKTEMASIKKIVDSSYGRGRMQSFHYPSMDFHVAGKDMDGILAPVVELVLSAAYESRDIKFEPPLIFTKEDGIKVINGIVKTGEIPKSSKPDKNVSAAINFGLGLKIVRRGAERTLDPSDNRYIQDMLSFIENKATDSQTIPIEAIYKNFTGTGGPGGKNYGLTRRMVQIYLLCLVQQGRIKVGIGPRSGLREDNILSANISSIDFNTKILDSMFELQKVAKPKNWEVLVPYAEKLLGVEIRETDDDSSIVGYRKDLKNLFDGERAESANVLKRARDLFQALNQVNPYETDIEQIARFFEAEVSGENDIDTILFALREAFGYKAYDASMSSGHEVDDLANRLKNYHKLQEFLELERELKRAMIYCKYDIPDINALKYAREIQTALAKKMADLLPYIDSEVKLKSELIGSNPPQPGDSETSWALVNEYRVQYEAMHNKVMNQLDDYRGAIRKILLSDEMKASRTLEQIPAIEDRDSRDIADKLEKLENEIFSCPNPSLESISNDLISQPEHRCGLSFENAGEKLKMAAQIVDRAQTLFDNSLNKKIEIFITPAIQDLLEQGKSNPLINTILRCESFQDLKDCIVKVSIEEPSFADTVNLYLKKIVFRTVRIGDFKPSIKTVEKGQIGDLIMEFERYLTQQFEDQPQDGHRLILQLE